MRPPPPRHEERFRALYADGYADVLRFVQRRTHPAQAEDVAAEAFLVVWRRLDDAPRRPEDLRAWLFGIARHCLLNASRSRERRDALTVRLADATTAAALPGGDGADPAEAVARRLDLAAAWRQLAPRDQEVLALTVLDDLTSAQAANVLGTTATAYRLRLHRARRALRAHLDAAGPAPAVRHTAMETQS